jgi:hypothetical protein
MLMEAAKRIHGRQLLDALTGAGIIRKEDHVRRIVIDAQIGRGVIMYTERSGDERLLDVTRTLDGIEVRTGRPPGKIAGYRIGGRVYHPDDVTAEYLGEV